MLEEARSQISTPMSLGDFLHFALTWVGLFHGVGVLGFSWIAGLFLYPESPFEYALKLAVAAFILSLPAAIDTVRRRLNYTDLAMHYGGMGYFGGVVATAILIVVNLKLQLGLTLNQGVLFVALFALAVGGGFASLYKHLEDLQNTPINVPKAK